MFRCLSTALLFAMATTPLPAVAHATATAKPGAASHPMIAPNLHPSRPPSLHGRSPHARTHGKIPHRFHKFSHHRHKHLQAWGLPFTTGEIAIYPSYYDPADEPADADAALLSPAGPFPASLRGGVFYRTGCRSEEVLVPSAQGQARVTVTRCSVPIPELPTLK
jgi:hypothetical protein